MSALMPQPFKHPKTDMYYFRKVVPAHLRKALGRTEFRESLGTKDLREAKRLYPEVAARVDALLAQADGKPAHLTQKQTIALAGKWYASELAAHEDEPGDEEGWSAALGLLSDANDEGRTAQAVEPDVASLLEGEGLLLDDASRQQLSERVFWNKVRLFNTLAKRSRGDYSPDNYLESFPQFERPAMSGKASGNRKSEFTFTTLLDKWVAERKPRKRTEYEWRRFIKRLEKHAGSDDPLRLTKATVVAFKDALLAEGVTAKTIINHLTAARALFSWAVRNGHVASNPIAGVAVATNGDLGGRSRLPYSDADAKLLLNAARKEKGARRWIPWLLAHTGARLEEVCQPLASDVKQEGGKWYLDINADTAGKSVKNIGSVRKVPLHPALIREGFFKYVKKLDQKGPLFPDLKVDSFGKRGTNFSKVYGRWQRPLGITDPKKVAHSWRHRFKDLCRGAGIEKAIHDALTGHASSDEGDKYGLGYPLATLAKAIEKLPG